MKKLILASNNKGKIKEFREMFPDDYEIITMGEAGFSDEIEENGNSFYENALIKAKTVALALNCDAISDDSGLIVDALDGAPGIFSARYSGEHANDAKNRKLLLNNMKNVKNADARTASFHSTIVLYRADNTIVSGDGDTFGSILFCEDGVNGFGYDSLFYSFDLQKSFGVATDEEKNSVSHRRRALTDLLRKLK